MSTLLQEARDRSAVPSQAGESRSVQIGRVEFRAGKPFDPPDRNSDVVILDLRVAIFRPIFREVEHVVLSDAVLHHLAMTVGLEWADVDSNIFTEGAKRGGTGAQCHPAQASFGTKRPQVRIPPDRPRFSLGKP